MLVVLINLVTLCFNHTKKKYQVIACISFYIHEYYNMCINVILFIEFLQFALNQEEVRQKWLASVQECQRLHSALDKAHRDNVGLDRKLSHARRNLEEEKRRRRAAEDQRDSLVFKMFPNIIFIFPKILIQ